MRTVPLGDLAVSAIGLGGWPYSGVAPRPDERESIALIHHALDAGITLLDSADSYQLTDEGPGHSERLMARALREWGGDRSSIVIASKGGRAVSPAGERYCAASPAALRAACEGSLTRLGVDAIDLYYLHRPDPAVPFEDSVGELVSLAEEGAIRRIGISNVDSDQIRAASSIAGDRLVAVQNEFSPFFSSSRPEVDVAASLGLAFVAYAPFGGATRAGGLADRPAIAEAGASLALTPHQVVIAWMLTLGAIPIPATTRAANLDAVVAAAEVELPGDLVAAISAEAVAAGAGVAPAA